MRPGRHAGKAVIVTGASSGIGRRIAFAFADEGAAVTCASPSNEPLTGVHHDTDVDRPTEVVIEEETDGEAMFVETDVSDPGMVRRMVDRTVDAFGGVDVLVNNAGILIPGDSQTISLEDWERVLAVNLSGTFYCSRHAVPFLKEAEGWLINIASVNATEGGSGPAYAAAKAGQVNLTRDLAVELGPHGVNVNAISPGYVKTPIQDYQDEADIERSRERTLLPRLGDPEDIASVASFLATDAAGFIHGANIPVDGGWSAHRS